jgi:hypothetical protein
MYCGLAHLVDGDHSESDFWCRHRQPSGHCEKVHLLYGIYQYMVIIIVNHSDLVDFNIF